MYQPVRILPENNSEDLSAPVTLKWQKGFPINYSAYLQVSSDSDFNNIVLDSSITAPDGVDDISIILNSLTDPGTFYWRAKQGGIPPQGAFNEPWKFSISPGSVNLRLTVIPEGYLILNNYEFELTVYLRNVMAPFDILDSCFVVSSDSAYQNDISFKNAKSGTYYIVINIPGCIETWSKEGGEYLEEGSALNEYDFSTDSSKAYGNNLILKASRYCIFSGNVVRNHEINLDDIIQIINSSGLFTTRLNVNDLTGDKLVDLSDVLIVFNNSSRFVSRKSPLDSELLANDKEYQITYEKKIKEINENMIKKEASPEMRIVFKVEKKILNK